MAYILCITYIHPSILRLELNHVGGELKLFIGHAHFQKNILFYFFGMKKVLFEHRNEILSKLFGMELITVIS